MYPTLRLYEDVLANGAEASWPALPRMIFVVHGARHYRGSHAASDEDTFGGEGAVTVKAGAAARRCGAGSLLRTAPAAPPMRAAASSPAKSSRRALRRRRRARCSCAATASHFRPAAAPICTGTKDRASVA